MLTWLPVGDFPLNFLDEDQLLHRSVEELDVFDSSSLLVKIGRSNS